MKIMINTAEQGTPKSYMLDFGRNVTAKDMTRLLQNGEGEAADALLAYSRHLRSSRKFEIALENRITLAAAADYVLSREYTGPPYPGRG